MKLTSIPHLARNANRLREIVTLLSKYGLADWLSNLGLDFAKGIFKSPQGQGLGHHTHEQRIRLVLTELGTTFIKLGQMLSTRPDLIGPKLARELTALQTDAPADTPARVRALIEAELGQPIDDLFATFDDVPLASASVAQVHRARLKDGRDVVLKVQHAGIEARIRNDLDLLLGLASLAEKHVPDFRQYQPRATAAEFQRTLLRELDFGREERNLQQFASNFARDRTVHFPATCPEYSTNRILTMEYLEGVKLSDPQKLVELGYDLEDVARRGAVLFLEMIFRDGFYHADPHPGNLLVLPGGVIGMLDGGMVGRMDGRLREDIEEMLLAIAHRDAAHLTALITRVGAVPPGLDQAGLGGDLTDFLAYYAGTPLGELDLGRALTEMTEIIRRYHILLPPGLALLIKVLVMLEGTSRLLHPKFNLTQLLKPYQRKLLLRRLSPARRLQKIRRLVHEWEYLGEVLPRGIVDLLQQVQTGRFDVHLEHKRLEPSVNRLVLGMLASALFLGSSLLWSHAIPPLVAGISIPGALGCGVSVVLGLRLLWAIRKSGHLDRQG